MYNMRTVVDNNVIYIDMCTHKYIWHILTHIHLYKNQWPYNYAFLTRHLLFVLQDEIIISIYFWSLFKSSVWCTNTNTKNFPTCSSQVAQIEGKPFGNLFWQLNILKVIKQTRIVWPNYEHTQPSALWERGGHKVILPVLDISKQQDKLRQSQKHSSPNCTKNSSLKLHRLRLTDSRREEGCIQTHGTSASIPLYHTSPCQHSQSLHHVKRPLCHRHLSQILLCNVFIFFLKYFLSLVTD